MKWLKIKQIKENESNRETRLKDIPEEWTESL